MAVPNLLEEFNTVPVPSKKKKTSVPNFLEEVLNKPTVPEQVSTKEVPLVLPKNNFSIPGLTPMSQPKTLPEPKFAKPFFEETLNRVIEEGPRNQDTSIPWVDRKINQFSGGAIGNALKFPKAVADIPDIIMNRPLRQEGNLARLSATGDKYMEALDTIAGVGYKGEEKTFGDKLTTGAGNLFSNFIPAAGIGRVAVGTVNAIKSIPKLAKYAPVVGTLVAQGALNAADSSMETGEVYKEILAKTKDPEYAADVSQAVFGANVLMSAITNRYAGFFDVLPPGAKNAIKRALAGFVFEGGQESGQQIISNYATGKPLMENVKDSLLIGGILGSGATLATANIYNQDGTVNKDAVLQTLNDNQIVPINIDTTPSGPSGNVKQEDSVVEQTPQETGVPNFLEEQVITDPDVADVAIEQEMNTSPIDEQIASVTTEITPLVEQFNDLPDLIKDGPDGKALQDQIESLNQKVTELTTQKETENTQRTTQKETENTQRTAKKETRKGPVEKQNVRLVAENVVEKQKQMEEVGDKTYSPESEVKINDEVFKKPKSILSKTDLRSLVKNMDVESIDVEVGENNTLVYKEGNREFTIKQSALGLVPDKLTVGEKVTISRDDLDVKGTKNETTIRAQDKEGNVLASKLSRNINDFEFDSSDVVQTMTPEQDFKLYNKMTDLIRKYATRISEGNVKKGAAGTFNPQTFSIRTKGLNDVSTIIHEITHHIDFFSKVTEGIMEVKGYSVSGNPIYSKDTLEYRKALSAVYLENYPGARSGHSVQTKMKEGYAMLLEGYIQAPTMTKSKYPSAVKEFLQEGGKFYTEKVGEFIKDARQIINTFHTLEPVKKIGSTVTLDDNVTNKENFLTLTEKVYQQIADGAFPLQKITEMTGFTGTNNDIYKIARFYGYTNSYFANNVTAKTGSSLTKIRKSGYWGFKNGEFKKTLEYNWGDLMKGLREKKIDEPFNYFLVARRHYFEFQELKKTRQQISELEATKSVLEGDKKDGFGDNEKDISLLKVEIKTLKETSTEIASVLNNDKASEKVSGEVYFKYKQEFKEETEMFDALIRSDIDLLVSPEVGLINKDTYDKLVSTEGYAPFKRKFYNEIQGDGSKNSTQTRSPGKLSFLKERKGSGKVIISPVLSGIRGHSETLSRAMTQYTRNKLIPMVKSGKVNDWMEFVDVKRAKDENSGAIILTQKNDPNIVLAKDLDGKDYAIEMDKEIKNTIDFVLDYSSVDIFSRMIMAVNRSFTKGTTAAYLWFAPQNLLMDQVSAGVYTKNGYIPLYSAVKNLYLQLSKKDSVDAEYFQEFITLAGDRLAIHKAQEMTSREMAEYITNERKGIQKFINYLNINKGLDVLAIPNQWSEIITRGAEYVTARKAGKPQVVAMAEAAGVAGDFTRIGKWGSKSAQRGLGIIMVRGVPYFNAGIQIGVEFVRSLKTPEGRKRAVFVGTALTAAKIASLSLLITAGTEEQKELYKDLEAEDLAKNIFIPNPSNPKELIRLRLPEQFLSMAAIVNMGIAEQYLGVRYSVDERVAAMTAPIPSQLNVFKPISGVIEKDFDRIAAWAYSWLPQAAKVPTSIVGNFTDFPKLRPLEGPGQLRKPAEYRFTDSTPLLTRLLGEKTGLSPIKLDHFIVGYFGRVSNFFTVKPGVYSPAIIFRQKAYHTSGRRMQYYYKIKESVGQDYSYKKISDKVKKGVKLTEDEQKTLDVYRAINGYSIKKRFVKDTQVDGIEDIKKKWEEAVEKNDQLKASILFKKMMEDVEKLKKYDYK